LGSYTFGESDNQRENLSKMNLHVENLVSDAKSAVQYVALTKLKMDVFFKKMRILDDMEKGRISRVEAQKKLDMLKQEYYARLKEIQEE